MNTKEETNKEIKYLCLVNRITPAMKSALEEVPKRGGFYNWLFLFKGDLLEWRPGMDLEKYDVVHINLSPSDQVIVPEVRRQLGWNSKTKLVLNNDHVQECWSRWGIHPQQYWDIQEMGDMVFGTEKHQVSHMIPRAKIMPHPHDFKMISKFSPVEINNTYGNIFHWWEGTTFSAGTLALKLRKEMPEITSRLYAYQKENDKEFRWTRMMFDELYGFMTYPDYMDSFMSNKFVFDYTSYHTYGRNSVDAAMCGTPMMGSNTVASMRRCFPYTTFDPRDIKKALEIAKRLINDEIFREVVIKYAKEASKYYDYPNAKERFLKNLKESENDERFYK